jgi:hypothetical protein
MSVSVAAGPRNHSKKAALIRAAYLLAASIVSPLHETSEPQSSARSLPGSRIGAVSREQTITLWVIDTCDKLD